MTQTATPEPDLEPDVGPPRRPWARPTVFVIVTVATFLFVAWHSSGTRSLLERLDRHMVAALFVTLGLLVALSWTGWLGRGPDDSRLRRALRRTAGPAGLVGSVIAFSIPVFASWQRGHAYSMIGGAVPWADAHLYFGGAQRLLFLDDLDAYNSRRPLTAMFLALRLAATRLDLRLAMLIGALVVGTAVFLAARAVARDLGPLSGLALFAGIYGFTRYHVPTTASEILGVTFAALAFASLWGAVRNRSHKLAVGSVVLLAVAFDVRAGAFMLPVLMSVWLARHLRASGLLHWRLLGACGLALVVAIGLNVAAVAGLGGDTGNSFGNGGMLLYGMAKGHASWDPVDVAWFQVYEDHPEIIEMTETSRNQFVNSLAREEIFAHPGRFLGATARSYDNYLTMAKRSILGPWPVRLHRPLMLGAALAIAAMLAVGARRRGGGGGGGLRHVGAGLALFAGTVVAIPPLVNSLTPLVSPPVWLPTALVATAFLAFVVVGVRAWPIAFPVPMSLVGLLAVVLSLPFIGTDSIRLLADGIVMLSLPLALAVAVLTRPRHAGLEGDGSSLPPSVQRPWLRPDALPLLVGAGLLATVAVGAPMAMAAVDSPSLQERTCPDGRAAEPLIGGVAVQVIADPAGSDRAVDELGLEAFTREARNFVPVPYGHLSGITGPVTVVGGMTPAGADRFAILDGEVPAPETGVLYLCGDVQRDPLTDFLFTFLPAPADVFRGQALDE